MRQDVKQWKKSVDTCSLTKVAPLKLLTRWHAQHRNQIVHFSFLCAAFLGFHLINGKLSGCSKQLNALVWRWCWTKIKKSLNLWFSQITLKSVSQWETSVYVTINGLQYPTVPTCLGLRVWSHTLTGDKWQLPFGKQNILFSSISAFYGHLDYCCVQTLLFTALLIAVFGFKYMIFHCCCCFFVLFF